MSEILTRISDFFIQIAGMGQGVTTVLRLVFPVLALMILVRCAISLLGFQKEPEIWGHIAFEDGSRLPVTHWENTIGRTRRNDIQMNFDNIYKQHAVLTRYDDGSWTIGDVGGRGGIAVNGETIGGLTEVGFGDLISQRPGGYPGAHHPGGSGLCGVLPHQSQARGFSGPDPADSDHFPVPKRGAADDRL